MTALHEKKRLLRLTALIAALSIIASCLESCAVYGADDFYAGEPVSPADIESIAALLSGELTDRYPSLTDESGATLCCWTPGGSVYHLSRECFSLASSSEIVVGSVEDALKAGKSRCCSVCGKTEPPIEVGGTDFDSLISHEYDTGG